MIQPTYYTYDTADSSIFNSEDFINLKIELWNRSILKRKVEEYNGKEDIYFTIKQTAKTLCSMLAMMKLANPWQTIYGLGYLSPKGIFVGEEDNVSQFYSSTRGAEIVLQCAELKAKAQQRMSGSRMEGSFRVKNQDRGAGVYGQKRMDLLDEVERRWGKGVRSMIW